MDYSFEVCFTFGDVFLSDDKKSCALVLYPDKKKTTFKSILLDAKLILSCVGLKNIKKTLLPEVHDQKSSAEGAYVLFMVYRSGS